VRRMLFPCGAFAFFPNEFNLLGKSDYRTFGVELHLSGQRVNQAHTRISTQFGV
jgi:hypothetical protein